jgi:hypothetical protein
MKVVFSIRLPADVKKAAEKRAAAQRRTLVNLIETLLAKDLEQSGYLPSKNEPRPRARP